MKRFLGLVLIAFISTNIFAIDFGGLISSDSSFDKQGSDDFVFTEKLDSSAYIKIPFSKDGKISLASEFLYRFQYSDSKINHYLDLPLFKLNFSGDVGTGVLDIYAGRYSVSDSTAKIFNQTSDGMFVSYSTAPFVTSFYIGYTGLVNRYLVSMVEGDITEYSGYKDAGVFGQTLIASILYMITSGCTASTQYAYAEMLRLSTDGEINFVEDTREYARRAEKMKKIFTDNGFHIVYDYDATQVVGDGFFFTIGYGNLSGGDLLKELLYYGVSSISLSTTGSDQQGVRACTSRMKDELYEVMEERMKAFHEDHKF